MRTVKQNDVVLRRGNGLQSEKNKKYVVLRRVIGKQ